MSLVPTYVKAEADAFNHDVIIRGDDFFICFDDDDPPELVIMEKGRSESELRARCEEIFKETGLNAKVDDDDPKYSGRCFNKDLMSSNFEDACAFFIEINSPIPVDSISEHEGKYNGKGEAPFETCEADFNFPKWRKNKFGE